MLSQDLGFISSWKMLTRDKGWVKPLLVLTLVSWIPILGQIAVLGYALEWARLTAWGVDSAPKQRGVKYGKVLTSGGIALLVCITMSIVLALVNIILFGGSYVSAAFPLLSGMTVSGLMGGVGTGVLFGGVSFFAILLMKVVNVFFGTFISAAMLRATVYDSFSAGWRVDRLFQMVLRDIGGFFHTYAVSLIGSIICGAISGVVAIAGGLVAGASVFFLAYHGPVDNYYSDFGAALMHMGALPILLFVILIVIVFFALQVVGVAMQLVSINAVGQWFCRFDVNRWGVSSAPLPDGTPHGFPGTAAGSAPCPPAEPGMPNEVSASAPQPAPEPVPEPVSKPASEPASVVDDATTVMPANEDVVPTAPLPDAPAETTADELPAEPVDEPVGEPADEPVAEKKPIPLGPISDDAQKQDDENGPIQA